MLRQKWIAVKHSFFGQDANVSLQGTPVAGFWVRQDGQDIAEYAVMLAVILAIAVATIRFVGASANNVFSSVASSIQ